MIILDNDNFEEEVLNAEGYVLVDFWGESCEPCKALMPHVEELSEKYEGKMKFCKLNTSNARRLAIKQKVLGLPTIVFYKDGVKVESLTAGKATATNIEDLIKKFI